MDSALKTLQILIGTRSHVYHNNITHNITTCVRETHKSLTAGAYILLLHHTIFVQQYIILTNITIGTRSPPNVLASTRAMIDVDGAAR